MIAALGVVTIGASFIGGALLARGNEQADNSATKHLQEQGINGVVVGRDGLFGAQQATLHFDGCMVKLSVEQPSANAPVALTWQASASRFSTGAGEQVFEKVLQQLPGGPCD
ncbi:MAG: hypothetical protein ACREGA_04420 [Candidatus Saccharimonadales bacterium]